MNKFLSVFISFDWNKHSSTALFDFVKNFLQIWIMEVRQISFSKKIAQVTNINPLAERYDLNLSEWARTEFMPVSKTDDEDRLVHDRLKRTH